MGTDVPKHLLEMTIRFGRLAGVLISLMILVVFGMLPATALEAPAKDGATALKGNSLASSYDVIIVGGDAEGVAAAVSAARAGAHTLLLDTRPVLGGLLTQGWLNTLDMNLDENKQPLNGGVFSELYQTLEGNAFDVQTMIGALHAIVTHEPRLDVLIDLATVLPEINGVPRPLQDPGQTLQPDDREPIAGTIASFAATLSPSSSPVAISGVNVYFRDGKSQAIRGKHFIDATQDADLACAAGALSIRYGQEVWGKPRNMAVTPVFRLEGLADPDWELLRQTLRQSEGGLSGADVRSAWGFGEILKTYRPASPRIGVRALNIGRQNDGSVLINALHIFGIDGLDRQSRLEARRLAEAELPRLSTFLRATIPGFSHCRFVGIAPELYVRTTRNIITQYTLSVDDLLENRDFPDRIAFGSYPLDIQATDPSFPGEVVGKPRQYAVPLRSLIPRGFTNLLVVGRSAGFDSLAQSSARTIPVGIAAGQGAGVAAAVSLRRGIVVDQLASNAEALSEIHQILQTQGARLEAFSAEPSPETRHWTYPGLRFLRRHGLASGGYQNSYSLDRPMSAKAFLNRLFALRHDLKKSDRQRVNGTLPEDRFLTLAAACGLLAQADEPRKTDEEAFSAYTSRGFFAPPWPEAQARPDTPLTYGMGYVLLLKASALFP